MDNAASRLIEACGHCPVACKQPFGTEIKTVDGVFIKEMHIPEAFTVVPQHIHKYNHTTLVATGIVRVWIDGEYVAEYKAPSTIFIAAGKAHTFQSGVPDTILYCIHNLHGEDAPDSKEQ